VEVTVLFWVKVTPVPAMDPVVVWLNAPEPLVEMLEPVSEPLRLNIPALTLVGPV